MAGVRRLVIVLALGCGSGSAVVTTPSGSSSAACMTSRFEPAPGGVTWVIGDRRVAFRTHQTLAEQGANYQRRTVRVELADDPSRGIEASCYTETDCDVPADTHGNERWCLVSHRSLDAASLFEAFTRVRACEPTLELLEGLAMHSAAPTCMRAALGTYPGLVHDRLGELAEGMRAAGAPASVITAIEQHAKAAADADRGYRDPADDALAARELRALRAILAPHTTTAAGWTVDAIAQSALAQLERRYPATLVGPGEVFYDVVSGANEEIRTVPTPPPWQRGR